MDRWKVGTVSDKWTIEWEYGIWSEPIDTQLRINWDEVAKGWRLVPIDTQFIFLLFFIYDWDKTLGWLKWTIKSIVICKVQLEGLEVPSAAATQTW